MDSTSGECLYEVIIAYSSPHHSNCPIISLIVDLLIGSDPCIVGSVPPWLGAALTGEVLHTIGKSSTAHLQQENTIAVDIHFGDY